MDAERNTLSVELAHTPLAGAIRSQFRTQCSIYSFGWPTLVFFLLTFFCLEWGEGYIGSMADVRADPWSAKLHGEEPRQIFGSLKTDSNRNRVSKRSFNRAINRARLHPTGTICFANAFVIALGWATLLSGSLEPEDYVEQLTRVTNERAALRAATRPQTEQASQQANQLAPAAPASDVATAAVCAQTHEGSHAEGPDTKRTRLEVTGNDDDAVARSDELLSCVADDAKAPDETL